MSPFRKGIITPLPSCFGLFLLFLITFFSNSLSANNQEIYSDQKAAQEFVSSNLPVIVIDTYGQTIQDDPRIVAHMGVIDNAGSRNALTDPFNNYDGLINIEIRGSSGQMMDWPKKQYGFETCDSLGDNRNVALLGLPAENDWILYPPYSDKSMLRNVLAYRFARDMGRYASRTRFCELVLNGEYCGVYVLLEKIKRDKRRVNVAELQPDDNSGDELTGGYIIKVDRSAGEENEGWTSPFSPNPFFSRVEYLFHYPKPADISQAQQDYIENYITAFETIMDQSDWKLYYQEYFDVDAFIDFWLINELTKNVDSFSLSTFFYKNKDSKDKRLVMGPVWDFNLGFGNVNYFDGQKIDGFILDRKVQTMEEIPVWFQTLARDQEIRSLFAARWQELRGSLLAPARINSLIDSLTTVLDEAQERNFTCWPILGQQIWPNNYVGQSYSDEIVYLKDWIQQRCEWIDNETKTNTLVREHIPVRCELLNNYPNPFNESTFIAFRQSSPAHVKIVIYDVLGRMVTTLLDKEKNAGYYRVVFNATGLAGGIYFIQVTCAGHTCYSRMTLVK